MLLKETLKMLPNAKSWYEARGNEPMRVVKCDCSELPRVTRGDERPSIEEVEEYYELRAVRTFNDDFDWELVR